MRGLVRGVSFGRSGDLDMERFEVKCSRPTPPPRQIPSSTDPPFGLSRTTLGCFELGEQIPSRWVEAVREANCLRLHQSDLELCFSQS